MKKRLVSIIIPIFNESDNIDYLVSELNYTYDNAILNFDTEFIFVDDGSADHSFEALKSSLFGNYKAKILKLSKNYGAHAAIRAGNKIATGDFITYIGADLQDTSDLPKHLFDKISEGSDIIWAIRRTSRAGFFEQLFSRIYSTLMKKYALENYPDRGIDICMYNRKVQEQLNLNIESNSSLQLQILSFGFKEDYIEYDKIDRKHGNSKWTLSKKIKLVIDSFVAFSYAPIRFVTITGISFFIIGSLWMVYIILRKIFVGDLASGWPALVSILLIGFGVTNISLGIIAEYLWRTLDASRKRPTFIIDEIIEITP